MTLATASVLAAALTCVGANTLRAQVADTAVVVSSPAASVTGARRSGPVIRVTKWTTLALSVGAAAYGFSENRTADRDYQALEERCKADPFNCIRRTGDAYADAEMERIYQNVRTSDRHARTALLASQIGIAASVALFIIDLRDNRPPDNIPYEPRALQLVPGRDGAVQLRFTLPLALGQR